MRGMSPTPAPPPPPAPTVPDQTIVVSVPSSPAPPGSSGGPTSFVVSIPQQVWDKLTTVGHPRCRSGGFGGFLCEHGETVARFLASVSSIVTAVAVVVGGIWAYQKFVRGRTFQPRSVVTVSTQWHELAGVGHALQVRISVANIGASILTLVPSETGVQVLFPAAAQTTAAARSTDEWWADIRWEPIPMLEGQDQPRTFAILNKHAFVEPGETVFADMLLNPGREPTMVQVQVQLCWEVPHWFRRNTWVYDYVDQIIPPDSTIYETKDPDDKGSKPTGG